MGDVADTAQIADLLRSTSIDGVIHFAGRKYVAESMRDPGRYFRVNTVGSLSVLEAMVAAGTDLLVFSSSCTVYGTPDSNPVTEDMPIRPNPYGTSKVMVEQMLRWSGQVHGIRSLSLRYFNAAGASFDAALGERFDRTMMLIPMLMQATLGQRRFRWTSSAPTTRRPMARRSRDYIHVEDLVAAHIGALDLATRTDGASVLNLGTGVGSSVREVIALVEEVTGRDVPVHWSPHGAPGMPWRCGRTRAGLATCLVGDTRSYSGPWWRQRGGGIRLNWGNTRVR